VSAVYQCVACKTLGKSFTPACLACDTPNAIVKAPNGTHLPRRRSSFGRPAGSSDAPDLDILSEDSGEGVGVRNVSREPATSTPVGRVKAINHVRVSTGLVGFNRVLGKNRGAPPEGPFGAARGSRIVIAGGPGIGKSTLLVQTVRRMASQGLVIYATGEQAEGDIRLYAESFGKLSKKQRKNFRILESNSTDDLITEVEKHSPLFLIIDSLQTFTTDQVSGDGGSKPQALYMDENLLRGVCKPRGVISIIVSQVTKEGVAAGSNTNAHLADTLLFFSREDDEDEENPFRILSAPSKNRLGATGVKARFKMTERGLVGYKIKPTPKVKKKRKTRRRAT
jgi:DNA repair protein RadA/Sms